MSDRHVEGTESPPTTDELLDVRYTSDFDMALKLRALLTEREELREALACPAGCGCVFPNSPDQRECACDGLCTTYDWQDFAAAVLSSRETTDSPRCPTCGSDDPNVRGTWYAIPNSCTDPFHSTDSGKDSP